MVPYLKSLPTPHQPELSDSARIYQRLLLECTTAPENMPLKASIKRFCYLGVKGLPIIYEGVAGLSCGRNPAPEELLNSLWKIIMCMKSLISGLTPYEFITIFPVEKRYDGGRHGVENCFSTLKYLRKIGMDTVIGDHVDSLLLDYQNPHVRKFNVFKFDVEDLLWACQGKPSVIEVFLAENGVYPLTIVVAGYRKRLFYGRTQ